MSVLNINQVSYAYLAETGAVTTVLENISLEIRQDSLVVVLGPSGCGKTTLLNLIAGFTKPRSGFIDLNNKRIEGPSAERGVISQQDALLPWLNVSENVSFGLKLQGKSTTERQETATRLLNLVGLEKVAQQPIWTLSGGMKQRVSLARALAANPQLLLMDEAFGALDAFTREQMQELLLTVQTQTHKQILLITHDIEEAVFLATDLILLAPSPGRIVERIRLDFGQRFNQGESTRMIKSDPAFIQRREEILAWFFAQRSAENRGQLV